jgi:hypothetical protein
VHVKSRLCENAASQKFALWELYTSKGTPVDICTFNAACRHDER